MARNRVVSHKVAQALVPVVGYIETQVPHLEDFS